MDHRIHQMNHHPLSQIKQSKVTSKTINQPSFQEILKLQQNDETLRISKHARKRLDERNIKIDEVVWAKMEKKINEAKLMGIDDSIVVTDQATFVVNAKKKIVITAMNREEAASQIFTNINGTILL
jgi:flagellar operon protein